MRRLLTAIALVLALVAGTVGSGSASTAQAAVVDARLTQALASAAGPVEVIVTFHGETANADLLRQVGINRGVLLNSLPMAGVLATRAQVEALAARPEVRSLYLNDRLTYYNSDATEMTGVDLVRLDSGMTLRNGGLPVSGRGIGVVVNDSGVDGTHKDIELGRNLKQNVMASANLHALVDLLPITYLENVPNSDTNSGHGTHVAGTVGGTGAMSGGKYEGVAPGASLIGYGSGAALFVLDGIGGFDYAITHQAEYGIRVITNSWGSSGGFDPNHPINVASYKAWQRNMVVLFAAGNEGPGENTHNPYAKAPWVISVAAGEKQGRLASFSSRGTAGVGGSFQLDGRTWTWEDRPTVTAPGVDIISTRVIGPVSSLGAPDDINLIEPAYLPFYTTMSGTSMATPVVAGIVALMLEANPMLTPDQVKQILQQTATNMPGMEPWEVGAGYVNAYAAVEKAFSGRGYGATLNLGRNFNSSAQMTATRTPFTVNYNPLTLASSNRHSFTVPAGVTELGARVDTWGLMELTGNTINLVLIAPDGTEYSSGVNLLFALYGDRTVSVPSPAPGTWHAELRGLRGNELNPIGIALPEEVPGVLTLKTVGGFTGLNDINGHPAEAAIKVAVSERLVDGYADGTFLPGAALTRRELAQYLVMGAAVRQSLAGAPIYRDVTAADRPFVEAVTARGAALRDRRQTARGAMLPAGTGTFAPTRTVTRAELAYSLVQSLGLEAEAVARNNQPLTVQYGSARIAIDDAGQVPAELRGYVQLALDLNIMNAYFSVTQGPFDLQPVVRATFRPGQAVTRGEYAVAAARFYSAYLAP